MKAEQCSLAYCIGWQRLSPDASTVPPEFVNDLLSGEPGASRLRATANRYVDLLTERDGELRILATDCRLRMDSL